ncbi:hypothetical protein BV898_13653 [Hypsibius exemplaris]|uniref:RRM domain-containing protein n=1 Tax=Hypsibius exemplaris TaxID=2072580 RepID=A0A1W0WA51_HYPEX|nr:hypothetical protein BV898_13653 [Hypsibius exemplaris]
MDSDTEDLDSEMSFGSSHSSCEISPSALCPTIPLFVDPSNVEDLHNYIRTKQQSMIRKLQVQSGVVFFSHVPYSFNDAQLTKYFSRYGTILRVRVFQDVERRNYRAASGLRCSAFMEFANSADARLAVQAVSESPVYSKLFQCKFVEPSQVPANAFEASTRRDKKAQSPELTVSRRGPGSSHSQLRVTDSVSSRRQDLKDAYSAIQVSERKRKRKHSSRHRSRSPRKRSRRSPAGM